ncbi:MAG: SDR family NAD(P)-dependent oxidoreductase [Acidobacteriota bacterium]|nr:SDR family NAD(P)-dependent oxidoreductase [Acidobacteriota bacterium]
MSDRSEHDMDDPLTHSSEDDSFAEDSFEEGAYDDEGLGSLAVVGYGLRFPGAADPRQYWHNLREGVDSISHFSEEELLAAGVPAEELAQSNYVRARGAVDGADLFDAPFFDFTDREAETLDPQHRIFLEVCWEALEHAGYDPKAYPGAAGIFAGSNLTSYLIHNLVPDRELVQKVGPLQIRIRNDKDFLSTLVAYKLDFKGPAVNVQTACSTSLVATSLACQSLLGYQCDLALAGGISITSPPRSGYLYQEGVYALDGVCRAFDAEARGTVLGDGAGVVVLKRLEDALADGDTVHAVIRGFATNNDGSLKLDYTAPSVDGQAEVVGTALALAGLEPEDVSYIETHGTGTPLGDPIEIAALKQAFEGAPVGSCAIGSVKPNIGHLDAAAGVASLIKTVLALEHGELPPSLHYEQPNPRLGLEGSPFAVNDRLRPWEAPGARRAGISSFGVGGTNAHVVVEEAPAAEASLPPRRRWQLLTLSAKDEGALDEGAQRLAAHLEQASSKGDQDGALLADAAFTLHAGRRPFPQRRLAVVENLEDGAAVLRGEEPRRLFSGTAPAAAERCVAFLFPGIGDQYVGMGRGLYQSEEVFRAEVDSCAEELEPLLGLDLRQVLFADDAGETDASSRLDFRAMVRGRGEADESEAAQKLARTELLHPVLFVVELALARLWQSWGVEPSALLGYSIGEYAAACVAGVFSRSDALRLVARRAAIVQALPAGAMLAVTLPEEQVRQRLGATPEGRELSVAAVNGPAFTVVAGPEEAVQSFQQALEQEEISCRRLAAQHAFHSTMMEAALDDFRGVLADLHLQPPQVPLLSNVSGTWMTDEEATDPEYWAQHLCRTVRFGDGVEELWQDPRRVLLEVGPGRSLGSIALQNLREDSEASGVALASLGHHYDDQDDQAFLLTALGRLWLAGAAVDWEQFHLDEGRRRVPLPTYAFQRRRHWVEARPLETSSRAAASAGIEERLVKRSDPGQWLYRPGWRRGETVVPGSTAELPALEGRTLVFLPAESPSARALAAAMDDPGGSEGWLRVQAGEEYESLGDGGYCLRPDAAEDWEQLFQQLRAGDGLPALLLHLGCVAAEDRGGAQEESLGFYSLLALAQAWGNAGGEAQLAVTVVATNLFDVTGDEILIPRRATVLGTCRGIPQEYPQLSVGLVDLPAPPHTGGDAELAAWSERWGGPLLSESASTSGARSPAVTALRGRHRWLEDFMPVEAPISDDEAPDDSAAKKDGGEEGSRLRRGGVYLLVGGLGGIGLSLAEHLARRWQARLVLVGRSDGPSEEVSRRLRDFEAAGAEVLVLSGDVTDEASMEEVREKVRERFGTIHGVVHAAGHPPGGLIQLKDRQEAAAVLAPKVDGSEILARTFAGGDLDFLLLCSSLTALTGALGLVDHCAANAYLDAFAHSRRAAGEPVISVNWDTWLEVGQAAEAGVGERLSALLPTGSAAGSSGAGASNQPPEEASDAESIHPLLGHPAGSGENVRIYLHDLPADHWILLEHRLGDQGLVPGTAYLEMARAALSREAGDGVLVLHDVGFAAPCRVPRGDRRRLRTTLERPAASEALGGSPGEWSFRIESSADGEGWELHASGRGGFQPAAPKGGPAAVTHLEEARQLRPHTLDPAADRAMAQVHFGPRWREALQELRTGEDRGWARLELSEDYHREARTFGLHPALADSATGLARVLTDGAFLPLGYGTVWIQRPLGTEVESLYQLTGGEDGDTLSAEVQVFDGAGREVLRIEDYRLRRLSPEEMASLAAVADSQANAGAAEAGAAETGAPSSVSSSAGSSPPSQAAASMGILPAEGARVFEALLDAARDEPQVAISVRDLDAVREQAAGLTGSGVHEHLKALGAGSAAGTGGGVAIDPGRRRSQAPYEAPRNDLEQELLDLFTEMLGGDQLGIHDNFFDLGGNSLVATQLISRLREELDVEIPLRTLFEAPTVAELSVAVVAKQAEDVDSDDLAEALAELRNLSPEERAALLAEEE